jgi:hypothetical protein
MILTKHHIIRRRRRRRRRNRNRNRNRNRKRQRQKHQYTTAGHVIQYNTIQYITNTPVLY